MRTRMVDLTLREVRTRPGFDPDATVGTDVVLARLGEDGIRWRLLRALMPMMSVACFLTATLAIPDFIRTGTLSGVYAGAAIVGLTAGSFSAGLSAAAFIVTRRIQALERMYGSIRSGDTGTEKNLTKVRRDESRTLEV